MDYLPILILPFSHPFRRFAGRHCRPDRGKGSEAGLYYRRWERERQGQLLASKRFKRYLTTTKSGNLRLDRAAIKEASRYDGKWVLETNDDTISLEDAALGYKSLLIIERCFR